MDRFRMLPSYHYEDNTNGSLLKSVGKPLRDYKIEGNCFQDGVPSPDNPIEVQCCGEKTVNMIDYTKLISRSSGGVTFTNNNDGTFTANGKLTALTSQYPLKDGLDLDSFVSGETYYASCGVDYNDGVRRYYLMVQIQNSQTGAMRYYASNGPNATFSLTENESVSVVDVRINSPTGELFEVQDLVFYPIICKASEYVDFEPYGYKVPVTVEGKNMFDFDSVTEMRNSGGTVSTLWEKDGDELIVDRSKYGGGIYFPCNVTRLKAGTYTLSSSVYIPNKSGAVYMGYQVNTDSLIVVKQINVDEADTWVNIQASFEVAADTDIVGIVLQGGGRENYDDLNVRFKNIQLEKGNSATKYEPYFEPETYNIYLDEPLRKVGDYADYIDFKRGKVVRSCVERVFDGTENWKATSDYVCYLSYPVINPNKYCLSTHLLNESNAKSGDLYFRPVTGVLRVYEKNSVNNWNRDLFVNMLVERYNDGVPVVGYFAMSVPTETLIDLPKIFTEKGTNIITVGTELQPSSVNYQYYKGGK